MKRETIHQRRKRDAAFVLTPDQVPAHIWEVQAPVRVFKLACIRRREELLRAGLRSGESYDRVSAEFGVGKATLQGWEAAWAQSGEAGLTHLTYLDSQAAALPLTPSACPQAASADLSAQSDSGPAGGRSDCGGGGHRQSAFGAREPVAAGQPRMIRLRDLDHCFADWARRNLEERITREVEGCVTSCLRNVFRDLRTGLLTVTARRMRAAGVPESLAAAILEVPVEMLRGWLRGKGVSSRTLHLAKAVGSPGLDDRDGEIDGKGSGRSP